MESSTDYNNEYRSLITRLWGDRESYESLLELYVRDGDAMYLERMLEHVTE